MKLLRAPSLHGRALRALTLLRDERGMALIEFAYIMPIMLALSLTGAEITHFVTTKMRVSQIALHVADHGARMGVGAPLTARTVTEEDINDLFRGAQLQSGELDILGKGRIILSSLEPEQSPNTANQYKINWQRCQGDLNHSSSYGAEGDDDLSGMGPTGRQVIAPEYGATMFVEVSYEYDSIVPVLPARFNRITEIAAMPVRDPRQTTAPANPAPAATVSTC